MAQHQELKRKGDPVHQTAKRDFPPPLSIEIPRWNDFFKTSKPFNNVQLPVDILLLTVKDCEFLACYAHLRNPFRSYHRNLGYVYFGTMGEGGEDQALKVALLRCFEGSSGPGGSFVAIRNAVVELRPKAVFYVGCCMGLNPEVTKLGDVVVSSQLTTKAFKTPVRRDMMHLVRHADFGWVPPLRNAEDRDINVHCYGEILSGMDPVDAKQLGLSLSEAIAFETGGEGVFVAAHDMNIEWVIVKGISHFFYGSNTPDYLWKSVASIMAASVVSNMLKDPLVFKEWPHYGEPWPTKRERKKEKEERMAEADSIPASVLARGDKALAAYRRAIETGGSTYDKRVKILVVGQDRVGKTSLCKALRGEPFDEAEISTDGVQMMPAVKNAGTGPWRNPASLEHTTVYDHKIAKKTAEVLFTTRERLQGPKDASIKKVQSSFGDENPDEGKTPTPAHQEKKVPREIQEDEDQDPQEEKIPETVALLLEEDLKKNEIDSDENIWPVVWDFAGQDVYRAVHPIFMSSEDIYLLVFDLTTKLSEEAICRVNKGHKEHTVAARDSEDTNLDHLLRWMDLIHSLKKDVEDSCTPVILVGTHADCVDDPRKEMKEVKKTLRKELGETFLRHIVGQLPIDNKNAVDKGEIIELRNLILEKANEMPQTKKEIPLQWHLVEKNIITELVREREKYLEKESFREKLQENIVSCRSMSDDDFDELVYFLHDRGTIVYYEHKHADQKECLIFLDPQWLINLLCQIIKVIPDENEPLWVEEAREKLAKEGVLSEELIKYTCKNEKVDLIKSSLISLMDEFNLICKWPEKTEETQRFLVPCMLSSYYKEEQEEIKIDFRAPVYLNFKTEYVPSGLFCRLVVLFGKTPHLENTRKLYANEAKFALDNENHVLQLLCYKRVIKLRISAGLHGISQDVHDNIVSQLNRFLERLRKECNWLHSMSVTFCARCTLCIKTTPCHRHEKSSCGHHDCSHYIPLEAPSLCCQPGKPLDMEPLDPWILAVKKLKLSKSRPNSHDETRPSQGIVKKDVVSDYDLEGLSLQLGNSWECLARRLEFIKAEIENFNNPTCSEKHLEMLQRWKKNLGWGATYQVLYNALCHKFVNRKDLAERFCIDKKDAAES